MVRAAFAAHFLFPFLCAQFLFLCFVKTVLFPVLFLHHGHELTA